MNKGLIKRRCFTFIRLAASLLKTLCSDVNIREQVKVYEGIRICLRYKYYFTFAIVMK